MIEIGGQKIGPGEPCYIIAEVGVSHGGNIETAMKLIDAAARAGANAVKLQAFNVGRLLWPESPQYRTLLPLELSEGQLRHLKLHADDIGITFLASPDQWPDADLLEAIGVPAFKIGSGHVRDLALLRHVARKGKPIILSTGMSTLADVAAAVSAITGDGNEQIVLLHCTSIYPTSPPTPDARGWWDPATVNLRAIDTLATFGYPVGWSDHCPGAVDTICEAAAARGASIIERHIRLDDYQGVDWLVSATADLFRTMVWHIRQIEEALGDGVKRPQAGEELTRKRVEDWRGG